MKKWAKIFEVLDTQVLFYIEPYEENYVLHQMAQVNDVCYDIQIRNIPKDLSDVVFDGCDESDAESVVKQIEDMIEEKK